MLSKRLYAMASYVSKEDKVIDVGCDHGYLGIYLKKNNLCQDLLLTDIKSSALEQAKKNIKNSQLEIATLLTDGLENIALEKYNTLTISGMGKTTIMHILKDIDSQKSISKIIIESNNELPKLRLEMQQKGYYLQDETTLQDKNIWYVVGLYTKHKVKLTKKELHFGLNKPDKKEYFHYLLNKEKKILALIPQKKW